MAADKWKLYNKAIYNMVNGTIDLDSNDIKMALFTSAADVETLTHDDYADLSDEVANGNGYTTGGQAIGSLAVTESGGVMKFDGADPMWTAAGGIIGPFRYAVLYDATSGKLIAYSLLDNAPDDIEIPDGDSWQPVFASAGIFTGVADNS